MKVIVTSSHEEMCRRAARFLSAQLTLKPDSVLGLATGSTPEKVYEALVEEYKQGLLDFSRCSTVNLDEYIGLGGDHPQSYRYYMNHILFDRVNVEKKNTFVPDGLCKDPQEECEDYDLRIAQLGGVDLQLLGLGPNGHIGFNEPDDAFAAETHVVQLTDSTRQANSRFFASLEQVPTQAITMGIGTILRAQKVLLIASGKAKAQAVRAMLCGPVTPKLPASALRFHQDATVIVDQEAFSLVPDGVKQ